MSISSMYTTIFGVFKPIEKELKNFQFFDTFFETAQKARNVVLVTICGNIPTFDKN